jgi:homoserine O-acetyltransferase
MKKAGMSWLMALCVVSVLALLPFRLSATEQRYFNLGDLGLEGGGVIRDARLGYRTFGVLDAARSNAVIFPSWFMGTSGDLAALIGPGKVVDSSRYFVIAVDSFGNGVSSSPSNSVAQKGRSFPDLTTGDMVRAQLRLVTEELGISRLHAVIGISMGGMQAYQWMAAYPDRVRKVVPITGTPGPASYDLLLYRTQLAALEDNGDGKGWNDRSLAVVAGIDAMMSNTPGHFIETVRDQAGLSAHLDRITRDIRKQDPQDRASQLKTIIRHDVTATLRRHAGTAGATAPRVFTVVSKRDLMVNPGPAIELAGPLGSRTLVLDSGCGHYIFQCEFSRIASTVSAFLDE